MELSEDEVMRLHANAMSAQLLLVGLMLALRDSGTPPEVFKQAFDYADRVGLRTSDMVKQGPLIIEAIDSFRDIVIPHDGPKREIP